MTDTSNPLLPRDPATDLAAQYFSRTQRTALPWEERAQEQAAPQEETLREQTARIEAETAASTSAQKAEQEQLEREHGKLVTVGTQYARGLLDFVTAGGAFAGAVIETAGALYGDVKDERGRTRRNVVEQFGRDLGESATGKEFISAMSAAGSMAEQEIAEVRQRAALVAPDFYTPERAPFKAPAVSAWERAERTIEEQEKAWPTLSMVSKTAGTMTGAILTGGMVNATPSAGAMVGVGAAEGAMGGAQSAYEQKAPLRNVLTSTLIGAGIGAIVIGAPEVIPKITSGKGLRAAAGDLADRSTLKALGFKGSARQIAKDADVAEEAVRNLTRTVRDYKFQDGTRLFETEALKLGGVGDFADALGRARDEINSKLDDMLRSADETAVRHLDVAPNIDHVVGRLEKEVVEPLRGSNFHLDRELAEQLEPYVGNVRALSSKRAQRLGGGDVGISPTGVAGKLDAGDVGVLQRRATTEELWTLRRQVDKKAFAERGQARLSSIKDTPLGEQLRKVRRILEEEVDRSVTAAAKINHSTDIYTNVKRNWQAIDTAEKIAANAQLSEFSKSFMSGTGYLTGAAFLVADAVSGGGISAVKAVGAALAHKAIKEKGPALLAVLADRISKGEASKGLGRFARLTQQGTAAESRLAARALTGLRRGSRKLGGKYTEEFAEAQLNQAANEAANEFAKPANVRTARRALARVAGSTSGSASVFQNETTVLSESEEKQFRQWVIANGILDVDSPDAHYDYRGYFKESGGAPVRWGVDHFPDTYKQHGHPTFSVESKYSRGANDGGTWDGEKFIPGSRVPMDVAGGREAQVAMAAIQRAQRSVSEAEDGAGDNPSTRQAARREAQERAADALAREAGEYDATKWASKTPNPVQKIIYRSELLDRIGEDIARDATEAPGHGPVELDAERVRQITEDADGPASIGGMQGAVDRAIEQAPATPEGDQIREGLQQVRDRLEQQELTEAILESHNAVRALREAAGTVDPVVSSYVQRTAEALEQTLASESLGSFGGLYGLATARPTAAFQTLSSPDKAREYVRGAAHKGTLTALIADQAETATRAAEAAAALGPERLEAKIPGAQQGRPTGPQAVRAAYREMEGRFAAAEDAVLIDGGPAHRVTSYFTSSPGHRMARQLGQRPETLVANAIRPKLEGLLPVLRADPIKKRDRIKPPPPPTREEQVETYMQRLEQLDVAINSMGDDFLADGLSALPIDDQTRGEVSVDVSQSLLSLYSEMPKPSRDWRGREIPPSYGDMRRGNALWEATVDPLSIVDDFARGRLDPDKVATVHRNAPGLMDALRAGFSDLITGHMSDDERAGLSDSMLTQLDMMLGLDGELQPTASLEFSSRMDRIEQQYQQEQGQDAGGTKLSLPIQPSLTERIARGRG